MPGTDSRRLRGKVSRRRPSGVSNATSACSLPLAPLRRKTSPVPNSGRPFTRTSLPIAATIEASVAVRQVEAGEVDVTPTGLRSRMRRTEDVAYGQARAAILYPQVLTPLNRSEEHTSELQSPCNLVCRLLLEKKQKH